jgi:DNA polymerase-3 subunit alpha
MENYAKKLSIQIDIDDLKAEKIIQLKELLQMHPGSQALNFVVYDNKEQLKLNMPSRKQKVKVSQELLNELVLQDMKFKLN